MSRRPLFRVLRISALIVLALVWALPPGRASATDAAWQGEYYTSQDLSGSPALVRSDSNLDFNWDWGSPDSRLPADHFSARWTRRVDFPAGVFRFSVSVDDGVRLYVDGRPIIDQWRITAPITYTSSISMTAGAHNLKVEYYENTERALIHVWWDQYSIIPSSPSVWQPPIQAGTWQGTYYNNRFLGGDPAFKRDDALIYFDWGGNGPGGGVQGYNFSVRWDRVVKFASGHYRFKVTADDGVRVWFDWAAIIDQWHDNPGQTYTVEKDVTAGEHTIVVQYYQSGGTAQVKFEWQDTSLNWAGNLITCMRPWKSWVKIYRLAPNSAWEDLRAEGYGPMAENGELKLFGLGVSPLFGWDGQPYKVELWEDGQLIRTEGDVLAGQAPLLLRSDQTIRTSWPCGTNIPQ